MQSDGPESALLLKQENDKLREQLQQQRTISEKMARENTELRTALLKAQRELIIAENKWKDLEAEAKNASCQKEKNRKKPRVQAPANAKANSLPAVCRVPKRRCSTPLDKPLKKKHLPVTRAMTKIGKDGLTALHRAVATKQVETVKELLSRGFNTRVRDRWGKTPLQVALNWKSEAAAEMLVEADDSQIHILDEDMSTLLHHAARCGYVGVLEKLIAAGASTRAKDKKERTALHCALLSENEFAAELLANADAETCSPDSDGQTPLHLAAIYGYEEVAKKLLEAGANIDLQNRQGRTALHLALVHRKVRVATLLVGGEKDIRDENGDTPLNLALAGGCVLMANKLLFSGVCPHSKDEKGRYPLHRALFGGNDATVKVILAMCALCDIDIDWGEMRLPNFEMQRCIGVLSECCAEIRWMKDSLVHESRVSFYDIARRHWSRTVSWLSNADVQDVIFSDRVSQELTHYGPLISFKVRMGAMRRYFVDRCLDCFSRPGGQWARLPVTAMDILLRCLSEQDMRSFVTASDSDKVAHGNQI